MYYINVQYILTCFALYLVKHWEAVVFCTEFCKCDSVFKWHSYIQILREKNTYIHANPYTKYNLTFGLYLYTSGYAIQVYKGSIVILVLVYSVVGQLILDS